LNYSGIRRTTRSESGMVDPVDRRLCGDHFSATAQELPLIYHPGYEGGRVAEE